MGRRQNSSIWSFLAVFVGYSTQFLAPGTISTALDPGYTKIGRRQNLLIWSFLAVFVGYSTQFLAPGTISTASDPEYTKIEMSSKTRRFGHFWPFLWAITHSFWLRGLFQRLVPSGTRKLGRRQNSSIWPFLAVFVGYSTHFFGFGDDFDGS